MADPDSATELSRRIRAEMADAGGALPFARFMELALYAPGLGYYERAAPVVGRAGDFYTSVSVGPVFGELLAFQFAAWLEALPQPLDSGSPFQIVEAGAHDGRLAADILGWFQKFRPDLRRRLEYCLIEPSPTRRRWQAATLARFGETVRWHEALAPDSVAGILFANELLDALPVHRLAWDAAARRWFEWGVTARDSGFAWVRLPRLCAGVSPPVLAEELLAVLPDGFTTEAGPAAESWWREAALALRQGWLLTADYGLATADFFQPQRAGGTLRAYHRHHFVDDLLARPGERDLTAQVNFTAVIRAGQAAGLHTETFTGQRQWLTEIMGRTIPNPPGFPPWDTPRVRQFQTLTHPEHLGRAFSVLVQRRGAAVSR